MSDELLALADELYALPLGEFTARRDALVREHRGQELAPALKGLRKPSMAAWVVNLLVRRDPDQVAQVLSVGEALREAQAGLDADDLRALTRQRRQLTAAVTTQARRLAREEGTRVTEAVAGQVEATLTAAMLDAGAARAVRSGLLVAALSATGVDAVEAGTAVALPGALGFTATAVPTNTPAAGSSAGAAEGPALHVVPDPEARVKARAAAEEAWAEAREEHEEAAEALAAAGGDVERLEARSLQLQAELDELRGRIAELESQQEATDDELADAEDVRAEAAEAHAATEHAVADARAALDRLS